MKLVHLLIDETAALDHVEIIDDILSVGRGFGERCHLFFQNSAQLMRCYPDGQHQFVLGTTTNLFFGAVDSLTCEEISKRCGTQGVAVESGGDSYGETFQLSNGQNPGNRSVSRTRTRNWSFLSKPLIRQEEVAALPNRICLAFPPGVGAPVLTWLRRFYETDDPPGGSSRRAALVGLARATALAAAAIAFAAWAVSLRPVRLPPPMVRPAGRPPPAKAEVSKGVSPELPKRTESWRVNESGSSSKRSPATSTSSSGTGRVRTGRPN